MQNWTITYFSCLSYNFVNVNTGKAIWWDFCMNSFTSMWGLSQWWPCGKNNTVHFILNTLLCLQLMLKMSDLWKFNTHLAPVRNTLAFLYLLAKISLAYLPLFFLTCHQDPESNDKWKGRNGLERDQREMPDQKEDSHIAIEVEKGVRLPQARECQQQQELGEAQRHSLELPGSMTLPRSGVQSLCLQSFSMATTGN